MENNQDDERLNQIEKRLVRIEEYLRLSSFSKFELPTTAPANPAASDASKMPLQWLGVISVLCFIFAAGFTIKLTIDNGWLTPARQIGLSYFFGALLITIGLMRFKVDKDYASFLPCAGIIILFITTYAAHQYYNLLSASSALALITLIGLISIYLYTQFKQIAYIALAAMGVYFGPLIFEIYFDLIFTLNYYIISSIVFLTIALLIKSPALIYYSAYSALIANTISATYDRQYLALFIALSIQGLLFASATIAHQFFSKQILPDTVDKNSRDDISYIFPLLCVYYLIEYYSGTHAFPVMPWVGVAIGIGMAICVYAIAHLLQRIATSTALQAIICTFITLVLTHSLYYEFLPRDYQPFFAIVFILICALPLQKEVAVNKNSSYYPSMVILTFITVYEYFHIADKLFATHAQWWIGVAIVMFTSLWVMQQSNQRVLARNNSLNSFILIFIHCLGVLTLYKIADPYSSLVVSISWLAYAIIIVILAFVSHQKILGYSALVILSIAAGKALIIDASSQPTIVRIVCLVLTGAVLYVSGLLLRKISEWPTE